MGGEAAAGCTEQDCAASAVVDGRCVRHLADRALESYLGAVRDGATGLDLDGARVDRELQERIAARLPWTTLMRPATLRGARFEEGVTPSFGDYKGGANFAGAIFEGHLDVTRDLQSGSLDFARVRFAQGASFFESLYGTTLLLRDATSGGPFEIWGADLDYIESSGAGFEDRFAVENATIRHGRFEATRFSGAVTLEAFGGLRLENVRFESRVSIHLNGGAIKMAGTSFSAGMDLQARDADLDLTDCEFGAATHIGAAGRTFTGGRADEGFLALGPNGARPAIVSLRRANVAQLSLSDVDLSRCIFQGAFDLDKLRGVRAQSFTTRVSLGSSRRVLLEEQELHDPPEPAGRRGDGYVEPRASADDVSVTYRALRKGLEDSRDYATASDFYYGEMQMRRRALRGRADAAACVERAVLATYWAISGYGTRAWRALLTLAVLLLTAGAFYSLHGFEADPSGRPPLGRGILFAARSGLSFLRSQDSENLTAAGSTVQLLLRIAVPALLALAALAVRTRVRRS